MPGPHGATRVKEGEAFSRMAELGIPTGKGRGKGRGEGASASGGKGANASSGKGASASASGSAASRDGKGASCSGGWKGKIGVGSRGILVSSTHRPRSSSFPPRTSPGNRKENT